MKVKELFDQAKAKVADGKRLAKTIDGRIKGARKLHQAIKEGGTESYKRVGAILKKIEEAPVNQDNQAVFFGILADEAKKQELTLAQMGRLFFSFVKKYQGEPKTVK